VRYAFIERHRTVWPVATQCRVLDVSASGYRQYRARQMGEAGPLQPGRRIGDVALLVYIKAIFNEMKAAYGWPRIWRELSARGIRTGKERVRKLMKMPSRTRQAQVQGDDEQFAWPSRLTESSGTQIYRRGAKSGLGWRHHLCVDRGRMALSRGRHRPVQPSGGRFCDERAHDPTIGYRRTAHGLVP